MEVQAGEDGVAGHQHQVGEVGGGEVALPLRALLLAVEGFAGQVPLGGQLLGSRCSERGIAGTGQAQ